MHATKGLGAIGTAVLVGVAIVGALAFAEYLAGRDPLSCKEYQAATQSGGSAPRTPVPSGTGVEPAYQAPDCSSPKNSKDDELCQQRRSASAAGESACVARWQLYVGVAGLIGLVLTIIYAAMQARTLVENERPWVGIETVSSSRLCPNQTIRAQVVIKNTGRTPAFRMQAAFHGYILPKGAVPAETKTTLLPKKPLLSMVLDYYHPFLGWPPLSQSDFDALHNGTSIAWIVGRVDYLDNADVAHRTTVCTRWDKSHDAFIPHDEGNEAT